jgi:regulator of sigma E protease
MINILGTILAFLIVFGILVFIHEFGHFFMGKLIGVRVEVFSFGYGKRLFGFKKGTTDYRVSALPLGGYCRFLGEGMFDPGRELAPDDFMSKNRGQRFLVMIMGSVMNIVLAVVLVSAISMVGETVPEYLDQRPVIGWIDAGSPAEKAGLRVEDEILAIGSKNVSTWSDVEIAIGSKPDKTLTVQVRRDGATVPVQLSTEKDKSSSYEFGYAGFYGKVLTRIQMVISGSPAEKGGLQGGDVVLAIDGEPAYYFKFIQTIEKSPGKDLTFTVLRGDGEVTLHVTPKLEGKVGKIGILHGMKSVIKKYGFFGAIVQSVKENAKLAFMVVDFLKNLFTGEISTRQLGGPLEIANLSYAAFRMGFIPLLSWIAFISLQLGVLNLVPIPVFDGGQLFVLIIESVIRRDLGPKARQVWMQVGFVIFVLLLVFLVLNDIVKRLPHGLKSLIPF